MFLLNSDDVDSYDRFFGENNNQIGMIEKASKNYLVSSLSKTRSKVPVFTVLLQQIEKSVKAMRKHLDKVHDCEKSIFSNH